MATDPRRHEELGERSHVKRSEHASELLRRFRPWVQYDSRESYRADSPAVMTDLVVAQPDGAPRSSRLRAADGALIASADASGGVPRLDLTFLGTRAGESHGDEWVHLESPDPAQDAARMHEKGEFADRVYGRAHRTESGLFLQYWFFYLFNAKFEDDHEGDWEMAQIELNDREEPLSVCYSQHRHARTRRWDDDEVEKRADADGTEGPVVYPGRGSHCGLFGKGFWKPVGVFNSWERNDGAGPLVRPKVIPLEDVEWARWPGHWGGTKREIAESPRGPMFQGQKWGAPRQFHQSGWRRIHLTEQPVFDRILPTPQAEWQRAANRVIMRYDVGDSGGERRWLRATLLPTHGTPHPLTYTLPVETPGGEIRLPAHLSGQAYHAFVTAVDDNNQESEPTPLQTMTA